MSIEDHADKKALNDLFYNAVAAKNWAAVKIICEMEGPNKPLKANKNELIRQATMNDQWQDIFDIETTFKKDNYTPTQGPLFKSIYTEQLEALARELMQSNEFEIKKMGDEDFFIFENGSEFNWTEIRDFANFQHITLDVDDFCLYANYLESGDIDRIFRSGLEVDKEEEYRLALFNGDEAKKNLSSPCISFQEMQAINVYTGGFYADMNALLRGTLDVYDNKQKTRKALITSVLCASGLQKVPETTIVDTYRGAKYGTNSEQAARVRAAALGETIRLEGFVSTSTNNVDPLFQTKPVYFHFTNVRGMNIAPISQVPDEREFLIPPTYVQLNHYKHENGKHYFEGAVVEDVLSLNNDAIERRDKIKLIKEALNDLKSKESEQSETVRFKNGP